MENKYSYSFKMPEWMKRRMKYPDEDPEVREMFREQLDENTVLYYNEIPKPEYDPGDLAVLYPTEDLKIDGGIYFHLNSDDAVKQLSALLMKCGKV